MIGLFNFIYELFRVCVVFAVLMMRKERDFDFLYAILIYQIARALFNEKMNAKETQRIAKRDPYCEFRIKPERRT
jgi:hypothetical protein